MKFLCRSHPRIAGVAATVRAAGERDTPEAVHGGRVGAIRPRAGGWHSAAGPVYTAPKRAVGGAAGEAWYAAEFAA